MGRRALWRRWRRSLGGVGGGEVSRRSRRRRGEAYGRVGNQGDGAVRRLRRIRQVLDSGLPLIATSSTPSGPLGLNCSPAVSKSANSLPHCATWPTSPTAWAGNSVSIRSRAASPATTRRTSFSAAQAEAGFVCRTKSDPRSPQASHMRWDMCLHRRRSHRSRFSSREMIARSQRYLGRISAPAAGPPSPQRPPR